MEIFSFGDVSTIEVTSKDVNKNLQILSTSDLERQGEKDQKDALKAQKIQPKMREPKTKRDQTGAAKNKKAKVIESLEGKPIKILQKSKQKHEAKKEN